MRSWSTREWKHLKKSFARVLVLSLLLILLVAQGIQALLLLPREVTRFEGDEQSISFDLPWPIRISDNGGILQAVDDTSKGYILNAKSGNYSFTFSLLGLLPLKQMQVNVIPHLDLVPSGHSIGVKLSDTGVIIAGLDGIMTSAGKKEPARDSGFQMGDILIAVNGIQLKNLGHAAMVLEELSQPGTELECQVIRQSKKIYLPITPVYDVEAKRPRLGLLLRDTAAGVGTMTFYHEDTGYFGALGHMITDENGGMAADLSSGRIVEASIVSIRPGQQGKPGEKQGTFVEDSQPMGAIKKNTELGIFGKLSRKPQSEFEPMPLGLKHEVKAGKAQILTVIEGDKVEFYDIKIEKLFLQNKPAGKGMVIKITDPKLLSATGGIVQGMSGSPIIQDGKIVGAVTHVFINEPQRGYGCFAEWMVLESGLLAEIESNAPPKFLEAIFLLFLPKKIKTKQEICVIM